MKSVIVIVMLVISKVYFGAVTFLQDPPILPPEPAGSGNVGEPAAPIENILMLLTITAVSLALFYYRKRKLKNS